MARYKAQFSRQLTRSHGVASVIADWFRESGSDVDLKPLQIAPNWESRHDYNDGGFDMTVDGLRVDVKGSYWNGNWTKPDEFPWPMVYVCPVDEYERLVGSKGVPHLWVRTNWMAKPNYYGDVTPDIVTSCMGIGRSSRDAWEVVVSRKDRTDNPDDVDRYWACPRDRVLSWEQVVGILSEWRSNRGAQ